MPDELQNFRDRVAPAAVRDARSRGKASSASQRRRLAVPVQADQNIFEHGVVVEDAGALKCSHQPATGDLVRPQVRSAACRGSGSRRALGRRKPVMTLNAVVLPAPFGPIRPTISPSRTVKFMSEIATRPPKCTPTCSTDNAGGRAAAQSCLLPLAGLGQSVLEQRRARPPLRRSSGRSVAATAGTMPSRQEKHDQDHEHAIDDPLRLRRRNGRSSTGRMPKIRPPTIGPASVPLPPVITMITIVTV